MKACFPWKYFLGHSAVACSKIFPTVPKMQSSRFDVGSPTGLPGFCSNTSWATFHWAGNTALFKVKLKTVSSFLRLVWCTMVHKWLCITSGPGAFLAFVSIYFLFNSDRIKCNFCKNFPFVMRCLSSSIVTSLVAKIWSNQSCKIGLMRWPKFQGNVTAVKKCL